MEDFRDYLRKETNKEVVKTLMQINGMGLTYCSDEMRSDVEIALTAVKENGWAYAFVCGDARDNREILLAAVEHKDTNGYPYLDEKYQKNKKLAKVAVTNDYRMVEYFPTELFDNKNVMKAMIQSDPMKYCRMSERLQHDRSMALMAIEHGCRIHMLPREFYNDEEILAKSLRKK